MDWTTLVSFYPDVETYTNQLRALEARAKEAKDNAAVQFLLAYHYLVQGHGAEARAQFEKVVALQPKDQLASRFVKALTPAEPSLAPSPSPAVAQAGAPGAGQNVNVAATPAETGAAGEQPQAPPPPPANLVGTWKSQPDPNLAIALTLNAEGTFSWAVTTKGETQTLQGKAGFQDNTLLLAQEQGPPLAGKIEEVTPTGFGFRPLGAEGAPLLKFTK
jgi:hypothetical protein